MTPQHRPSTLPWFSMAALAILACAVPALASDTPDPARVTVAGSLQSELGCPGDWQPDCASTNLTFDSEDGVWQARFDLPAGSWEYKAPLNGAWTENYGAGARRDGPNIPLDLAAATSVKFYYDHETHWITDNANSLIATAPGNFQSELGCAGDWDPSCLRSWLQDPDGDGVFTFRTRGLPAGSYEVKVAIRESWDENYGAGGVQNGANIPFSVPGDCVEMIFSYHSASHLLTVGVAPPAPQPGSVTVAGSLQSELGCAGDWQPDCAATHLAFDAEDGVWQRSFDVPAGNWEYKAPIDDSWTENYGANARRDGPNIPLNLSEAGAVKFYYDHASHWITDDRGSTIAVAPGSFQSELGCAGDWDPSCLRSWLEDPDGDGFYSFSARLPAGEYEAKVAIAESWDENYGAGGVRNGPNIPFSVPRACSPVLFVYDSRTHLLAIGQAGAPRGNLRLAQAHWVTADTIAWNLAPQPGQTFRLHWHPEGGLELTRDGVVGGSSIVLTPDPAGLPDRVKVKFPHLASFAAFRVSAADLGLVPEILKAQTAVSATGASGSGGDLLDATALQIPGVLDDLYTYTGQLGVAFAAGAPTLRVWAPTARSVRLHLFDDADPATPATLVPMTADPATGVWSVAGTADWDRKYYLYEVEVFARSTGQVETNLVTDPYSFSLSADSRRSQIVDLAAADLKPAGWEATPKPRLEAPEDIALYELHVRDFSISDATVPAALRGTFAAFTADSDGMRHLRALARAGLTHVHLLPSFDFATVPERRADQQEPAGDLASYPPDSELQQAAVAAVADLDGFNWGYDPLHYTVPEGGYATDPDGPARIRELRAMVQALNRAGLRVVMDVVYNHTNAAGQNARAVLDRVVPGYYHRLDGNGGIATSSCCPNTATEHAMMRKLMVDSVRTWAREYKVDGFRFDLMGHHMKADMLEVRAALDALTPAADGVDGSKVYVYGEGWNFGEVADDARGVNATQRNMTGTGIGTFCDRLRDGVRGGGPFSGLREQGFVNGLYYDPNGTDQGDELATLLHRSDWIRVGLAADLAGFTFENASGTTVPASAVDYNGQPAGYTADPQEKITYVEAHDNETLFDAIQLKAPLPATMAERVRMHNLGLSVVALSQGVPFFHAGTDMLRSKSLDRDSFNSGDWFNRLDFTYRSNNWGVGLPPAEKNQSNWPLMQPLLADPDLKPGQADILQAVAHLREMLAVRKSSGLFRLRTAADVEARLRHLNTGPGQVPGVIAFELTDADGGVDRKHGRIVAVVNAADEPVDLAVAALAAEPFLLHPVQAASADPVVRTASFAAGAFHVPARTTAVFVAVRPVAEQLALLAADVDALLAQGALNAGQANALKTKLEQAARRLAEGKATAAANQLRAFVQQVQDLVATGVLTAEQGAKLTEAAQIALGCIAG